MSHPVRLLRVRIPDQVVFRTFVAETVVLNLTTGRYHGLNTTAGRIMELFRESDDAGAVADRLSAETGQPLGVVEEDLNQFCRALAERGLIEVDGGR